MIVMFEDDKEEKMKKVIAFTVAILFIAMAFMAVPVYAEDTMIDKVSDWWATRGKDENEKKMLLTQRRAQRESAKAKKAMEKQAKEMEKQADKMKNDLKKSFGK